MGNRKGSYYVAVRLLQLVCNVYELVVDAVRCKVFIFGQLLKGGLVSDLLCHHILLQPQVLGHVVHIGKRVVFFPCQVVSLACGFCRGVRVRPFGIRIEKIGVRVRHQV